MRSACQRRRLNRVRRHGRKGTGNCPSTLARWPSHGYGDRAIVLETPDDVVQMKVFAGEIVWNVVHTDSTAGINGGWGKRGELVSCRAEACADTKRTIGYAFQSPGTLAVADADYLYWLGGDDATSRPPVKLLARTPRMK
jgi:hypothetical protein